MLMWSFNMYINTSIERYKLARGHKQPESKFIPNGDQTIEPLDR